MAIATAVTGLCQDIWIDTGSGGAPIGLVTGGTLNDAGSLVHRRGTGGQDSVRGAMFVPGGNVSFIPTAESKDWMTVSGLLSRAGVAYPCEALTEFDLDYQADGLTGFRSCKVNSFSLEAGVNDPVSCTMDFQGLDILAGSAGTGTTGHGWEWYDSTVTFESGSYSLEGLTINLENNLDARSDIDAPNSTGSFVRLPKRLFEGDEVVRVTLRTKNPIPPAVRGAWNDEPRPAGGLLDLAATFTNASVLGGESLSLAISGLFNGGGELPVEAEAGVVIYNYTFEAAINGLAFSLT